MSAIRAFGAGTAAVAIAAGMVLSTAPAASADVPLQWVGLGPDIWTLSDNGACSGVIPVHFETSPARPGHLTLRFVPQGQLAAPGCATTVRVQALTGLVSQAHFVRVDGGPATVDLATGTGVSLVSATASNLAKGVSNWVIVP